MSVSITNDVVRPHFLTAAVVSVCICLRPTPHTCAPIHCMTLYNVRPWGEELNLDVAQGSTLKPAAGMPACWSKCLTRGAGQPTRKALSGDRRHHWGPPARHIHRHTQPAATNKGSKYVAAQSEFIISIQVCSLWILVGFCRRQCQRTQNKLPLNAIG